MISIRNAYYLISIIIIISLLLNINLIICNQTTERQTNGIESELNNKNNKLIPNVKLLTNLTYCQMYSRKCIVKVYIENKNLAKYLRVVSDDKRIIRFKSMESCGSANLTAKMKKDCLATCNNDSDIKDISDLYLVYLKPKLVGVKNLEFTFNLSNYTDNSNLNKSTVYTYIHKVIISSPERFIDTFQLAYIVFFSFIMAIIMGILLDVETLIKIIKIPIPVFIGFFSQYFFMPLVNYIIFYATKKKYFKHNFVFYSYHMPS